MDNFFGVFLHPRITIRKILTLSLNYGVFLILVVDGCLEIFKPHAGSANYEAIIRDHKLIFDVIFLPFFIFLKYFILWVFAYFLLAVGKIFNGKASGNEMFKVVVWTMPPDVIGKLFFILPGIAFGAGDLSSSGFDPVILFQYLARALATGMAIWGLVISVIIFSEVQKISIGKTIAVMGIYLILSTGIEMLMGHTAVDSFIRLFNY